MLYRYLTCIFLFSAGLIFYLPLPSSWLRSGVVHVSPSGYDGFLGSTKSLSLRSIQRAADVVAPGETILLWPGIYRGSIYLRKSGTSKFPIHLKAAIPGTVILTQSIINRYPDWTWRSVGHNLYATSIPWRIDALRIQDVVAYRAKTLAFLEEICIRSDSSYAFNSHDTTLTVCIPDGSDPEELSLTIHKPIPKRTNAGGHQVALLWIEGSNIHVEDIHFEFVVMAAIQLWNTSNVIISNNRFTNADVGVNNFPSLVHPQNISIENNLSEYPPLYEWNRSWLSWNELYSYSNSSLTWLSGTDIHILNNIVCQAGDGIKISPVGGLANHVHGNILFKIIDDAFELDGPAINLYLRNNKVIDFLVGISLSPMKTGPVEIVQNIFIEPSKSRQSALFKVLKGPVSNILLSGNYFIGDYIIWNNANSPMSIDLSNNISYLQQNPSEFLGKSTVTSKNNEILLDSISPMPVDINDLPLNKTIVRIFRREIDNIEAGPPWLQSNGRGLSMCTSK